jgi:hypothetical protein
MPQELGQCQSGTHGHEPGKCPNPATEEGGMFKRCHDESRVSDVAVPASFRRRRKSGLGALMRRHTNSHTTTTSRKAVVILNQGTSPFNDLDLRYLDFLEASWRQPPPLPMRFDA